MKKSWKLTGFVVLALFLSSFVLTFISAYSYGSSTTAGNFLRTGSEQVIDGVVGFAEPFLQVLLGGENWSGYLLFERFLLFLLLISVIYLSLRRVQIFEENTAVLWVICLAVPLIGMRFIDLEWLNTIFIQYKVLAIALTAGLPFIIYFFFLYNVLGCYDSLRKIGWIFYAVIFFGLWATTNETTYGEVYLWTAALSLIMLLFDGTIRRFMINQQMRQLGINRRDEFERELNRQIRQTDQDLAQNIITPEQHRRIRRRLQRQLQTLRRN